MASVSKSTVRGLLQFIRKYQDPDMEEVIMVADAKLMNEETLKDKEGVYGPNTSDEMLKIVPKNILSAKVVRFESSVRVYDVEGSLNIWYEEVQ